MSDLKVVLYKTNHAPRSIALSTRMIYRTLLLCALCALVLVLTLGLAIRFYIASKAKTSQANFAQTAPDIVGPTNTTEEQAQALRDEIDRLNSKIKNDAAAQAAPKTLDSTNPALALFSPVVVDKTKTPGFVALKTFRYSKAKGKSPATLGFELHNGQEEGVQKGYIVVLARSSKALKAYPDVFNKAGSYLLDFEKGETFQVARFRMVNAQFDMDETPQNFQILIFTRNGELMVNSMYEVKADGNE